MPSTLQTSRASKAVVLRSGDQVSALGLGTWLFGENPDTRAEEIATLRLALDLDVTLIDTAEMYGDGLSESLIGEAISDRRDEVFLVSKVFPHNASLRAMPVACDRSLRRLRTSWIDLYLLHWRGNIALTETVEAFMELQRLGRIRSWGVSNFDVDDMAELWTVPAGRDVVTDQILYNLSRRGSEWDLIPWLRQHRIAIMAYSPIEQARLVRDPRLVEFAFRYDMTPAQAALAWLLSKKDLIAIPKTGHRSRLLENVEALGIRLSPKQLQELDLLFPLPDGPRPLEML